MGDPNVRNIFTKQITGVFGAAAYTETLKLTPKDKPYFAVRSFNEKYGAPFQGAFAAFEPIDDSGWALVDISSDGPTRIDFQFLEDMGLALKRDDKHYINKFAYFLYDPQDGLFANYQSNDSARNKKGRFAPFMRSLLTYVLPGEWWSTYYDDLLSDQKKKTRQVEIQDSWNDIVSDYGLPTPKPNVVE